MKLIWSTRSLTDRRDIRNRIKPHDPHAALRMDRLFRERAAQLNTHPELGRPGRVRGTRELVVHRNYILVYRVEPDAIHILTVWHVARGWPRADEA